MKSIVNLNHFDIGRRSIRASSFMLSIFPQFSFFPQRLTAEGNHFDCVAMDSALALSAAVDHFICGLR